MGKVTKHQLIEELAKKENISKTKAKEVFESVVELIKSELISGNEVGIRGLGTFTIVEKPEVTKKVFGKVQTIPARKKVKFKVSEKLAEQIGG